MRFFPSFIATLLSLVIFSACSKQESNNCTQSIDLLEAKVSKTASDFIQPIDTILLAQNSVCQLKSLSRIIYRNNRYYVLDMSGDAIYSFDQVGHFIAKYGEKGNGHGEYCSIEDFTVSPLDGHVIILSRGSEALEYDQLGKFIRKRALSKVALWNITATSWGYLCTTNHATYKVDNEAHLFYCFDKDMQLLSKHVPVLPYQVSAFSFSSERIKCIGQEVYYLDLYGSALYKIDGPQSVTKLYDFRLGNPLPQECLTDFMSFIHNQTKYDWIMDWSVSNNLLLLAYICNGNYTLATIQPTDDQPQVHHYKLDGEIPQKMYNAENDILLTAFSEEKDTHTEYGIVRVKAQKPTD